MAEEKAEITLVDPKTQQVQGDSEIVQGLGGMSFNVHQNRPFIYNGKVYVNKPFRDVKTNKMIYKSVKVNTDATLMRDEWIEIDTVVQKIARERLVGIDDLTSRGLTYNLTNALGKTVLEYQDMNDPGEANIDMNATVRGRNDAAVFSTNYLPIPIIYADFDISKRQLEASRNSGDPLDTIMVEAATRRVVEKAEDLLFTDTTFTFGGGSITSYISNSNINAVTLDENWDASGRTGSEIIQDVKDMKQGSIDANHYGPWVLYIPTSYETTLDDDYVSGYPKTIRERILEISGIEAIKTADRLADDTVCMVEMKSTNVRLINGFSPMVVQWGGSGGMVQHFKVMMIQVPQIRADKDGNSGIVVLS